MNKCVFTDIDGTLLKGFITVDFVEFLYKSGLFDQMAYQNQKNLMGAFKSSQIDFDSWLVEWAKIWGKGICGQKQTEIKKAARLFFPSFESNFFSSSKELVEVFQAKGYIVIGVTAGVVEVASLVKEHLNLDYVIASEVKLKEGVYTDQVTTHLHLPNGKKEAVLDFCATHDVSLKESIGIGDSMLDVQIISLMGLKIALNATIDLSKFGSQNGYLNANDNTILDLIKVKLG